MLKCTTLCYIEKDDKYLMLYRNKKKIDVNKGKWIGVGGHFLDNENVEDCLLREVKEETGLELLNYTLRGKLTFYIDDIIEDSYLYTADKFKGNLIDCDEGILKWIAKKDILNLNLWEGDYLFMNKLLNNEPYFEMILVYKNDKLIKWEVK